MKKAKKAIVIIVSAVLCAAVIAAGFSFLGSKTASKSMDSIMEESGNEFALYASSSDNTAAGIPAEKSESEGKGVADASGRKMIRDAELNIQTESFDPLISSLEKKLASVGGFIQESDISGSSYYTNDMRFANITLRVPAEKLDSFIGEVSALGVITSKNVSVRDVTSDYITTESRIKALETEQEALLAILKKADSISDIIEIQSRLSDVRAELENKNAVIKSYDELVAYSTVNVHVEEVKREKAAEQTGFGAEIKRRLGDNLYSIGTKLRAFAVWFVSSIPYFVLLAVIIVPAALITRRVIRKRRAKKENTASGQNTAEQK